MLGLQRRTSQHEHQLLRAMGFADSARAAEGHLQVIPNRGTTTAVVERANVTKTNFWDCVIKNADDAGILEIGQCLQTRPARNSSGKLCQACGEVDKPTSSIAGRELRRISAGNSIGQIKEINMIDKEGCSGIDVRVPSTNNPEMLVGVDAVHRRSLKMSTDCGNQQRNSETKSKKMRKSSV